MRGVTRRRITLALIGLLLLVLAGWFVQDALSGGADDGSLPHPVQSVYIGTTETSH